jgi:hypothetical protein
MSQDLFAQTAQVELEAWENFKQRYEAQVPPPTKAVVAIWRTIGWQLILVLLQAVGAIGLASLRTAEMFYIASAGTNPATRTAEAVMAILAIEFGIVVFAAIRTEANNQKLTDEEKLHSLTVSSAWLIVGEFVMLAISIVAGLGVSFLGFDVNIDFSMPLAVTLGAGASIVAAVAGMVIGAMLARWANVRDAADIKYRQDYAAWEEGLRDSWNKSPDKAIAQNQLKLAKKSLSKGNLSSDGPNERTKGPNVVQQRILAYLEEKSVITDDEVTIPGPTKVAQDLGVSKGYASDVIKMFRQNIPALQPGND